MITLTTNSSGDFVLTATLNSARMSELLKVIENAGSGKSGKGNLLAAANCNDMQGAFQTLPVEDQQQLI